MKFTKNSGLVKTWVSLVLTGYTQENRCRTYLISVL